MFKKQLKPLTDDEKSNLIQGYFKSKKMNLFKESDISEEYFPIFIQGTPYYTLINGLEFYFLFKLNHQFSNNLRSYINQFGVAIPTEITGRTSLVRLAFGFMIYRPNLSEADRVTVIDVWRDASLDKLSENLESKIIFNEWLKFLRALQTHEGLSVDEKILDGEFVANISGQVIEGNHLVDWYLEQRELLDRA